MGKSVRDIQKVSNFEEGSVKRTHTIPIFAKELKPGLFVVFDGDGFFWRERWILQDKTDDKVMLKCTDKYGQRCWCKPDTILCYDTQDNEEFFVEENRTCESNDCKNKALEYSFFCKECFDNKVYFKPMGL